MDIAQYYASTLASVFSKLGPLVLYALGAYLLLFRLPLLFYIRNIKSSNNPPGPQTDKPPVSIEEKPKAQQAKDRPRERSKPKRTPSDTPASKEEILFGFKAGEVFSKKELKSRYHRLLKSNHPDKISYKDLQEKKAADLKTKEINAAYVKLKSK
jgi:hypothetical protein